MANTTSITRRQLTNLNEPQQLRELNRQMEWIWHQLLGGLTEKAMSTTGIRQVTKRIETTVASELTVTDLEANAISAAMVNFMVANVDVANIDMANLNDLQAVFVGAANASIDVADIDVAHIKRMSTGTAFVREEIGGKVYIDDLAVSEANIVNLAAGTVLLNDTNGDLVELYVDNQGVVHTRPASYDGNDIIIQNTLNGNRIIQNSITADRLNANEIFALSGAIMDLIADHIDVSRISVGQLNANRIDLGAIFYRDVYFPDETDVSTLLEGQVISNGWITNSTPNSHGIQILQIDDCTEYAGNEFNVTFESNEMVSGGYAVYIDLSGVNPDEEELWDLPAGTEVEQTADGYRYTFTRTIDSGMSGYSYKMYAGGTNTKVKNVRINVVAKTTDLKLRFARHIGLDRNGLQVGGLEVDKNGNLTTTGTITGNIVGYLPLAGGAMTGPISYQGTKATYQMIKFIDNTADEYGNGIAIGGGGATIIGGGESAATASAEVNSGGDEILYLCNDGDVLVLSNLQNGWNNRKTFTFGANGTLTAPAFSGPLTGNVTGNCSGSSGSCTGNAATATALSSNAGNVNTPVYFSGGKPVATNNKLGAINANGYWGMRGADNGDSWIRTTSSGIIPVQSGGAGSGHCSIGTSSWYFSTAYIDNVYGKLNGSCTGNAANVTGTVAIGHGGTGATSVSGAQANLGIRRGTTSGGISVSAGSYKDYAVTWTALSSVPTVVVGFSTSSTAGAFGKCCVAVKTDSITKTGCTFRLFNGDSTARSPNISWIVIG